MESNKSNRKILMDDISEDTNELRNEIKSLKKEDQDLVFDVIEYILNNQDMIDKIPPKKVTNKERLKNLEKRVSFLEKQNTKK